MQSVYQEIRDKKLNDLDSDNYCKTEANKMQDKKIDILRGAYNQVNQHGLDTWKKK